MSRDSDYRAFIGLIADAELRIAYNLQNLPDLSMDQVSLAMVDEPEAFRDCGAAVLDGAACISRCEDAKVGAALVLMDLYKHSVVCAARVKVLRDVEAELQRRLEDRFRLERDADEIITDGIMA